MSFDILASGYGLAEAPTIGPDGSLLFSDVLGGGVHRIDTAGDVATVVPKRRGVGGIATHADGGLLLSGRDLVHVTDGQSRTVLHVDGVAGWNDFGTDADGRVYAGALRFAVFDPDASPVPGELWRVESDTQAQPVVSGVVHANGVAVAADGTVFVADTRSRVIVVQGPGGRRVIDVSEYGSPDGLALDEAGCLWVAIIGDFGIGRFQPDGTLHQRLEVPSSLVTSLCFGDDRDLFITTGNYAAEPHRLGCVLRTAVDVAGAVVHQARI